ncbi:MAG: hypothetical protein ACI9S8_001089 [Chlamydiales bacterium]|jgi:hypothetical protein
MRFALHKDHRNFFQSNGCIEFEGLLSEKELSELNPAIDSVLVKRLGTTVEKLERFPFEQTYLSGRDVSRENELIKQSVCKSRLAEIASQLSGIKPLRLAYDQTLFSGYRDSLKDPSKDTPFGRMVGEDSFILSDVSGFQGELCGLMLCLSDPIVESKEENTELEKSIFSNSAGSGVFFNQEALVSYAPILQIPYQRYLLIVYAEKRLFYALREGDPNTHELKKSGYGFGDKLHGSDHPIVYP